MRNLKKFLALVLATMMLLSAFVLSSSAAKKEADYTKAANTLVAFQIMKGNEKGDLMLENGVTRYQAALFFVQAISGETDVAIWNADKKSVKFSDVPEYGTAIDYAYDCGIVAGRGNGIFGYNDAITYQDMLVMAVRALGYETPDMSYPYGYILAAQKLKLTKDVDLVNYKAALTRGETAQIINNMLFTLVAEVDPVTDKILYPGEYSFYDVIAEQEDPSTFPGPDADRKELVEVSELAGARVSAVITEFVPASEYEEDSIDIVKVDMGGYSYELPAAEFGITKDTPVVDYAGLYITVYISVLLKDFDQASYDNGDAEIVLVTYPEWTTVANVTGAGDVKYVVNAENPNSSYLAIGGEKFSDGKYNVYTFMFDDRTDKMWESTGNVKHTFEFDAKDSDKDGVKYVNGNSYGIVSYRVVREYDSTQATVGARKGVVYVLYMPLSFGQYNVREIGGTNYTLIGAYAGSEVKNYDGEMTFFQEYTVDGVGRTAITYNTKKLSTTNGKASATVTVTGETVNAGDFMFYHYNKVDNILTVAKNVGTLQTGRLTTTSPSAKTVKIGGTSYEFGFDGWYSAMKDATYNENTVKTQYMQKLEAGKDNVQYVLDNGRIVFMAPASKVSNHGLFDYAVVSNEASVMAKLLGYGKNVSKYNTDLAKSYVGANYGFNVVDGELVVAMLNLETGAWELAAIEAITEKYDLTEEKFDDTFDVTASAEYANIMENKAPTKYGTVLTKVQAAVAKGIVAVVAEDDGAYTISADTKDKTGAEDFFVTAFEDEKHNAFTGLYFTDDSNLTNAIKADSDGKVEAERVTVDDETVIVVIDANGKAGARVGLQGEKNAVKGSATYTFYAASSDLIVVKVTGTGANYYDKGTDSWKTLDAGKWAGEATALSKENYYIATVDTDVEVERIGDDDKNPKYNVTLSNIFDMKAKAFVETITVEVDETGMKDLLNITHGSVVYKNEADELDWIGNIDVTKNTLAGYIETIADMNGDKLDYDKLDLVTTGTTDSISFVDANTVAISGPTAVSAVTPVAVNMTVVTLNISDLDLADYDFTRAVTNQAWSTSNTDPRGEIDFVWGTKVVAGETVDNEITGWEYLINLDTVNEINEPSDEVYDDYTFANKFIAPAVDSDDYKDGALFTATQYVAYNLEDGVLNVVVYKLLTGKTVATATAADGIVF